MHPGGRFYERTQIETGLFMNVDVGIVLIVAGALACVLVYLFSKPGRVAQSGLDLTKLSQVIDKSEHAVLLAKPDGSIEWVNPAFTRISGYEATNVHGKLLGAVLLGALHSRKAVQQIINALVARKGYNLDMRGAHKGGQ